MIPITTAQLIKAIFAVAVPILVVVLLRRSARRQQKR